MRKWLLTVLLCLMPMLAWAAPATPYGVETVPCYAFLTEKQQALLDIFYEAAAAGETRAELPAGTRYDDAAVAMTTLVTDFPELAGLKNKYALGYLQHAPEYATHAELRYAVTGEALLAMRNTLLAEATALARQATGNAFTREMQLHDALCARVRYDLSAPHAHNAYGALAEGRAACEGYAQAMTLLCRLAGIPCGMVTGMAWDGAYMQPHAWNVLCIGGQWCQTDVTYNDQQTTLHWYFNLTAAQMGADHQWDYLPPYAWSGGAEYHRVLGLEAFTLAEAENLLLQGMQSGQVSIRFAKEEDYIVFTEDVARVLERCNQRTDTPFYGTYQVMVSPQQKCVMIVFGT